MDNPEKMATRRRQTKQNYDQMVVRCKGRWSSTFNHKLLSICQDRDLVYGSQNVNFSIDWRIKFTNIRQLMLKLKTHSGFHDLFRF